MKSPSSNDASSPLCVTYTYPSQVTELRCASTIPSQLQVAWTYTGFTTPILLPRVVEQYTSLVYKSVSTGTQLPPSSTLSTPVPSLTTTSSSTYSSSTSASASGSSSTTTAIPAPSVSSGSNVGAIIGGVVGGTAAVVVVIWIILLLRMRRRNSAPQSVQIIETPDSRSAEMYEQIIEAPDSSRPAELYEQIIEAPDSSRPAELYGSSVGISTSQPLLTSRDTTLV